MKRHLTILEMAFEGRGIARRDDGKVVFVDGALPGDIVEDQPTQIKKRFDVITNTKWIKKSGFHVKSPCKIAYECGGCQWQHADPIEQDKWKTNILENALERIGKITKIPKPNFIEAPTRLAYRPRLTIHGEPKKGILRWGFFKKATHDVIVTTTCPIATDLLSDFLQKINSLELKFEAKAKIHIQEVKNLASGESQLNLTVLPPTPTKIIPLLKQKLDMRHIHWLGTQKAAKKAPAAIWWEDDITYLTSPFQFQQSNHAQNNALKEIIQKEITKIQPDRIIDLFCGSGNLSLPLLKIGFKVEGVEKDETAIEIAAKNLTLNKLKGSYLRKSATLRNTVETTQMKNNLVIVDPPRSGLEAGAAYLAAEKPKYIFYISCHPITLAKDLGTLTTAGYKIQKITAMDFFPGTFHIESFAILELEV